MPDDFSLEMRHAFHCAGNASLNPATLGRGSLSQWLQMEMGGLSGRRALAEHKFSGSVRWELGGSLWLLGCRWADAPLQPTKHPGTLMRSLLETLSAKPAAQGASGSFFQR